jgi:hypothetical protein
MPDELEPNTDTASVQEAPSASSAAKRGLVPRPFRAHAFLTVAVVGVLIGGGLRFLPTTDASAAGSSGSGAAATACSATPAS